ncbi:ABC transporter substrate-binding protein [Frankia sp. Ag45/Mut15]|uniref:ABC transporter substrate-binding protein n=1 Tax=Frankia umida TaxID=573489 RepID=A0ABT0K0P8_9ACTN|nr:ABC transporter substrate-binding protein [Frankia umida]MCK9877104.1 ABC transporter substrate-binding protein [Frankia umida]
MRHPALPCPGLRRRRSGARAPRRVLTATAALSVGVLLLAACGSDGSDGASPAAGSSGAASAGSAAAELGPADEAKGTPVRIGMVSDGKGPVSDLAYESRVADATVSWLNAHRGGIAGRPIRLVKCEALADPAKGTDCGNRMVEEKVAAVIVGSSSVGESIWQPVHAARIPMVFGNTSAPGPLADPDTTFALTDPNYGSINLPVEQAREKGLKKITAVAVDVPTVTAYYKSAVGPAYRQAGLDFELVPVPAGTADMTPQLQRFTRSDPGLVTLLGSDSFCISALNGLKAVGFTGTVTANVVCITDSTRKSVPGSTLKGLSVSAPSPVGTDNPSSRLIKAVVDTYGHDIDIHRSGTFTMFITVAALQSATEGLTGDVTPASITAAVKAMPEKDLPGASGLKFRCNGKAVARQPAACVRGTLVTVLDGKGQPTPYKPVGVTPIEG